MEFIDYAPAQVPVRIPEQHRERENKAAVALLIIGQDDATELALIAEAAPSDHIVAGMPTTDAWNLATGTPDPDLEKILRVPDPAGDPVVLPTTVTIIPEISPTSSATAYDAMSDLITHLKREGAGNVRIAELPPRSAGLAALLDGKDSEKRAAYIVRLTENAKPLTGRRPSETKGKAPASGVKVPRVVWEKGVIANYSEDDPETPTSILMEAAVRRIRTVEVWDDLNDRARDSVEQIHDLEVAVRSNGRLVESVLENIPDEHLKDPRAWLKRLPDSLGTDVNIATAAGAEKEIEGAIRAAERDLLERQAARTRTGWAEIEGEHLFMHPGGAIGENGQTHRAMSILPEAVNDLILPDPAQMTADREREVARQQLDALNEMETELFYGSCIGLMVHSIAGLGVGGTVNIAAEAGAGKTTVLEALGGWAGPHFGHGGEPMGTFDGSVPLVRELGLGLHDFFTTIDDSRERTTEKGNANQADAIDQISRRGYKGGAAGHRVKKKNAKGDWVSRPADRTNVAFIFAGEEQPTGLRSTLQRFWPLHLNKGTAFRSGDAKKFITLTSGTGPSEHCAGLIRWLAVQINKAGSLAAWRESWADTRAALIASRRSFARLPRYAQVAAVPQLGLLIWLKYVESTGAITAVERQDLEATFAQQVTENMLAHQANVGELTPLWEQILNSLRSAVALGTAIYEGQTVTDFADPAIPHSELVPNANIAAIIGGVKKGRKGRGDYMALFPTAVMPLLRTSFTGRQFNSEQDLIEIFKPVSLKDGAKHTVPATISGQNIQAIAIPWTLWLGSSETVAVDDADDDLDDLDDDLPFD